MMQGQILLKGKELGGGGGGRRKGVALFLLHFFKVYQF